MVVEGAQRFGTGGSPSANVNEISPTTITLTTSWEPFAAVLTVPSIAGKTVGTDGNDRFSLTFWTSAGSDFNARTNSLGIQTIGVDLWGIHIKRGTHTAAATDFYKAPELGPELARCQRYFCAGIIRVNSHITSSSTYSAQLVYPVQMRIIPSVTRTLVSQTAFPASLGTLADSTKLGAYSTRVGNVTGSGSFVETYTADAEL
jgi:hypothetical protein